MKKIIKNRYEITSCTAIAVTAGDATRQDALYFHDREDENHDGDSVVFGYDIDWLDDDFDFSDPDFSRSLSTDSDDLDTVRFESEDDAFQGDRLINWPAEN